MKTAILTASLIMVSFVQSFAGSADEQSIKKVITAFAKAADENDSKKLGAQLDSNYRIVMNQLFGSKKVSVVPRAVYLQKVKSKEWGGDSRTVTFDQVIVNGNSAVAKVKLKGKKMTFVSLITLVKNAKGEWKLVTDVPSIIK